LLDELEALDESREMSHYHVYTKSLIETRVEHHADLMLRLASIQSEQTNRDTCWRWLRSS
jgi:hypothetical protein